MRTILGSLATAGVAFLVLDAVTAVTAVTPPSLALQNAIPPQYIILQHL